MDLRIEILDPALVQVYRAMTSAQRIGAGLSATELVRKRLRAHFSEAHPEWDADRIEAAVAERLLLGGG